MTNKDKKIEPGMETEAIATLLRLSMPPTRKQREGITTPELSEATGCSKGGARDILRSREDLLPVLMIGYSGTQTFVYMPKEDAQEKYPDWIISEETS